MRPKEPTESGRIKRDGVGLFYEVYGTGEETILFIPSWSIVDSQIYKAQVPYFSEEYRVITYDPRGNGKSDRLEETAQYTYEQFAADAIAILDATNTAKAILVGVSYSGLIASIVAAKHPDRTRALIAIGPNFPLGPKYPYRAPSHFNAEFKQHTGWEKFNRHYWKSNYEDFAQFFLEQACNEPHSTKQIEDGITWAAQTTGELLIKTIDSRPMSKITIDEDFYRQIECPCLLIHGENDVVVPPESSKQLAELISAELVIYPGAGHIPHARFPAKVNLIMADFLERHLNIRRHSNPAPSAQHGRRTAPRSTPKILYLSSPIGLGHARRDLAIANELRSLNPRLEIDWLAQEPVARFLRANNESVHKISSKLACESKHIEEESGEHDLHAFQAFRRMDTILVSNFLLFQKVVEQEKYDLVIADEAWDVDFFWHEHPELKATEVAWLTDFVGFIPMPSGGQSEEALTSDYNAQMIELVERNPAVRGRSLFVGNEADVIDMGFGPNLPKIRSWVKERYEFTGYVMGQHPSIFPSRDELRHKFGFLPGEKVCIVTVGGSSVGSHLISRILSAYPVAKTKIPELRMIIVAGPRIDPTTLSIPSGVQAASYVPNLNEQLAACDLALVQGGLTTCMELTAAGTPYIYFPLDNHFEQQFHVPHRLQNYNSGIRMEYSEANPDHLAQCMLSVLQLPCDFRAVESDGASRAAAKIIELVG